MNLRTFREARLKLQEASNSKPEGKRKLTGEAAFLALKALASLSVNDFPSKGVGAYVEVWPLKGKSGNLDFSTRMDFINSLKSNADTRSQKIEILTEDGETTRDYSFGITNKLCSAIVDEALKQGLEKHEVDGSETHIVKDGNSLFHVHPFKDGMMLHMEVKGNKEESNLVEDLEDGDGLSPEEPSEEDVEEEDLGLAGKRKPDPKKEQEEKDAADEVNKDLNKGPKNKRFGSPTAVPVGRGWRLTDDPGKGTSAYAALDRLMEE
jgi:hypothetical protein